MATSTPGSGHKGSILVVDDDLGARQTLATLLESHGYEVRCAPNGATALLCAQEESPDLALLDVRLPDVDGLEVCRQLKADPRTARVPVIFISALGETEEKVKGFAAGGVDYIGKPIQADEVLARVESHVTLHALRVDLERRVEARTGELRAATVQLAQKVEALNRSEEALKERLQFETLLTDLSAQFVSVPADQVDREIENAQRRVCEVLRLDLSTLWQWSVETPRSLVLTHLYRPLGGPRLPERMEAKEYFPWTLEHLLAGRVVVVASMDELPAEAARDLEIWHHYGVKTSLGFSLSAGGGPVFGALSFNDMREERAWPEVLVRRLELVAQIFANALARKRADEALRESEARLSLAAASADAGLWELDLETRRFWATDKARDLFGLPADSGVTFDTFLTLVHPEDRERIQHTVDQVAQSGEGLRVEYRSLHPGGSVRWMVSRGRRHPESSAKPQRLMGVTNDITERKRTEEALRESEARFRNMADTAPVLIWMSSPDKLCTYFNQQWLTFTGRTIAQELGNGWNEGVHPDDVESCLNVYTASFDRREAFDMEYRLRRADGEYRWLYDRGAPRISPAGEFLGYIGSCIDMTERKQMEGQLQARLREIEDLKQQLEHENIYLREEVKQLFAREELVGQSDAMRWVLAQVEKVAPTDSTVLIAGETGTGKEMIARAIHNLSRRKDRALITVNCAALPPSLIESELFGREKGAYTGAMTMMKGRFELADGSTLFLDEIGELPLEVQVKLLRVLEEGRFERLGSTKTMHVDVRIIAASNRDLTQDVQADTFRKDLYYRLNVFPIPIPPLRERPEDIPLLAWAFVREFEKKMGKRIESIPKRSLEALQRYAWPGNVRELRNVIEHAMIVSSGKSLDLRVPAIASGESVASQALEDIERKHILSVLEKTRWRLTGQGGAAERLGLKRTTLQSRMKKLGIKRPTS